MSDKKDKKNLTDEMPKRSMLLWTLAGIYLLYTGYTLCSNVIKGEEGASIGFLLAGIVFLLIGGGLLIAAMKGYKKIEKNSREREAQEAAAAEKMAEETVEKIEETAEKSAPHKMTIAERAALANRAEDEEETEE